MDTEYIGYTQTENLLRAWPTIRGIKESLDLELQSVESNIASEVDGYIYTKAIGGQPLDSPPGGGGTSDKTARVAEGYRQILESELKNTTETIIKEKARVEIMDSKLELALRRLPVVQRRIVELFYVEDKIWKEVLSTLRKEGQYTSRQTAHTQRRKAIETVSCVLMVTNDSYKQIMKLVEVD